MIKDEVITAVLHFARYWPFPVDAMAMERARPWYRWELRADQPERDV